MTYRGLVRVLLASTLLVTAACAEGSGSSSMDGGMLDSTTPECSDGEQRCTAGGHQTCSGGIFVDAPCGAGLGCDAASGTCQACICTPGSATSCADLATRVVCADSCLAYSNVACDASAACVDGACVPRICVPGEIDCSSSSMPRTCNASGTAYDDGIACGATQLCTDGEGCIELCELASRTPTSQGCSFFALNMDNFYDLSPDSVVVTNPSDTLTANVSIHGSTGGVEAMIAGPTAIPPLGQQTFDLPNASTDVIESVSLLRVGGSFRVQSDVPVSAYLFSTVANQSSNDASCLLPVGALGVEYFVASYADSLNGYPSYVDVVATEDATEVTITAAAATLSGTGVPALSVGGSTTITMNRYDTLQVVAAGPNGDLTGTRVVATKPVAAFGAVECAPVPAGTTFCDHMEEQLVPVPQWGTTYVAAASPERSATERHYWRLIASVDGTSFVTDPPQSGIPATLNAGQWVEISTQESFVITGSHPFALFQYVSSLNANAAGTGDPSMITSVPVAQFLNSYVVYTPTGYDTNYVQIVRTTTDAVTVDGTPVPDGSYATVGAYSVADVVVATGTHVIRSSSPFAAMLFGYSNAVSYAFPAGMAAADLSMP